MKHILYILLFFTCLLYKASAQWVASAGEYRPMVLNTTTHRAYSVVNSVPTIVSSPTNVAQVIGGPHSACLIDLSGNVYCNGQNVNGVIPCGSTADQSSWVICMTDSSGNTIDPVVQVLLSADGNYNTSQAYWNIFAVTNSGKLYGAGELRGYVRGNGTAGAAINTLWCRINVGSGVDTFVTKVQGGYGMLAMTLAGSVYTWGGDRDGFINGQGTTTAATTPTKVTLPGSKTAIDIAGNGLVNAVVLNDGTQAMTGQQNLNDYIGIYPTAMTRSFQDVTSALGLPAPAQTVYMNSSTTYWILTTGRMFDHGDNSCGTIGNGDMLDWGAYMCCPPPNSGSPAPYNYDNGYHQHMQIHPVEPVPGKNDWVVIMVNPTNCWYAYALDAIGRFYDWGRNKFGPLINRIIGANPVNGGIGAGYPDSWEVPWVTQQFINPALSYVESTSPYCILNPSGAPCNTYSIPSNPGPTAALSVRQSGTSLILDASASSDNVYIMSYLHTQMSGTALQLKIRTGQIDTITNVAPGAYSFKARVTDNGFKSDSVTVAFTMLAPSSVPYSPGQRLIAH